MLCKSFRLVNFAPYLRRKCSHRPNPLISLNSLTLFLRSLCNYITLPNYKGRKYRKKNQLFWKNFANSKKGSTFAPGHMAEWSNAAVLKTVDLHGSGGSNPSLSAKIKRSKEMSILSASFCFCSTTHTNSFVGRSDMKTKSG